MKKCLLNLIALPLLFVACGDSQAKLQSPDKEMVVRVEVQDGVPTYWVEYKKEIFIDRSPLGVITAQSDLSTGMSIVEVGKAVKIDKKYSLAAGKTKSVEYQANEQTVKLKNQKGETLDLIFRVSNNGVAFAYRINGSGETQVMSESTGFQLPKTSTAFVSPMSKAKTGWKRTNPSYEDQYQRDMTHGTASAYGQGWVFPALFKIGADKPLGWILLSETGVDGSYVGSHLAENSDGGLYRIEFPHPDQGLENEPVEPTVSLPYTTPWRIAVIGSELEEIVESTLAQDLVEPKYAPKISYTPGRASWSWVKLKDQSITWDIQKQFVDFAADMGFEYTLVDGFWDENIGREKIGELSRYAQSRGVNLILWYNSNGNWNDATQTPKNCMNTHEARKKEMAWMESIGIKGIKVDFFSGDKQATMKLYEQILTDANNFGIYVNFHGATLPRGWDVMFPNFATDEAVMGQEFITFRQPVADQQPVHCTTLPFTRNVVAPMDFTPVMLDLRLGELPNSGPERRTSAGFELALPIIFYSAVQHYGLTPESVAMFPAYVKEYLSIVPTTWDETKLLGGYPGEYVVMARRSGERWFLGAISSSTKPITIDVDDDIFDGQKVIIISDTDSQNTVAQREAATAPTKITLNPNQGIVIYTK